MAPPLDLLGPPSLHHHSPATTNRPNKPPPQNHPPTILPPTNPCLDLFFTHSPLQNLTHLLNSSWDHDPLTTLKFICTLRRTPKTSATTTTTDDLFFQAVVWLHHHHPLTLASNIKIFSNYGSLKDLPQILLRVLNSKKPNRESEQISWYPYQNWRQKPKPKKKEVEREKVLDKKERKIAMAKRAVKKYSSNLSYRLLFNKITNLFAQSLSSDLRFLELGQIEKISLASKLCPSLDSYPDKSTLICEGIARKIFPRDSYKEIKESRYAYLVRDKLRKEVLVPLRKALEMRKNESETRKRFTKKEDEKAFKVYQKNYQNLFIKDEDKRFRVYLDIADGLGRRNGVGLIPPHQIVGSLIEGRRGSVEFLEVQWRSLVEKMSKNGNLNNCLAICNVSEDMEGTLMDFSIAMGLLISELNENPWKGKVFNHSIDPKLVKIEGDTLQSKIEFMKKLKCDPNIRFSKVFEQVLQVAIAERLTVDKMVRKIFVFTDMGFDKAANNLWGVWASLSAYQRRGFRVLPEIVFWNLKDSVTDPGMKHKGVTTVNGVSKRALSMFLGRGVMPTLVEVAKLLPTPEDVMKSAIGREELKDLFVVD